MMLEMFSWKVRASLVARFSLSGGRCNCVNFNQILLRSFDILINRSDLDVSSADVLIIPGGFGAAKNLSNFAVAGPEIVLHPDVNRVITAYHSAGKPIGMCCIAPVLAAKAIPGCEVTMGQESGEGWPFADATGAVAALGGKHIPMDAMGVHVDVANKLVTSPAYMADTGPGTVFESVGGMVSAVLKLK